MVNCQRLYTVSLGHQLCSQLRLQRLGRAAVFLWRYHYKPPSPLCQVLSEINLPILFFLKLIDFSRHALYIVHERSWYVWRSMM